MPKTFDSVKDIPSLAGKVILGMRPKPAISKACTDLITRQSREAMPASVQLQFELSLATTHRAYTSAHAGDRVQRRSSHQSMNSTQVHMSNSSSLI